ncbi:MAG TPA: hypothetical protein VH252_07045 [Chthoniobacterales bacterium]|nr:hypothetical protein [Chthoniobacterales bacterium]
MKRGRNSNRKGEGGLAIWIILLALLAGALWFLYSSRSDAEKKMREFAGQIVQTMAVNYDVLFLNNHMTPQAQTNYIPSWRDRMVGFLKGFGPMSKPIETKGDVHFNSLFFDPVGTFQSVLTYPTMTATMNLTVIRGMNTWQVDQIELVWTPPPTPTPSPTPLVTPSPTPTPTAEPKEQQQRRKKR